MKKLLFVFPFLAIALLFGCKKDKNDDAGTAKVNMHLTDGPGLYDAVNLNIQQIQVNTEGKGWITMSPVTPGFYDILRFRNGLDTLLGWVELPAGKISQLRLILGDGNNVVVNGSAYPLTTPSAQESGLKLNVDQTLATGNVYDVWIDFDAGRSIHQTGNGKYMLKPVMRAYTHLTNGRIEGHLLPLGSDITVYAINGADTLSAIPNPDGYFAFTGLNEGTYQLWFDSNVLQDKLITNIQVSFGVATDVGVVTLLP